MAGNGGGRAAGEGGAGAAREGGAGAAREGGAGGGGDGGPGADQDGAAREGGERRVRLFAAVGIPEEVRAGVDAAAAPLRQRAPELRWTDAGSWHITVVFLGWTDPALLGDVEQALAGAAASASPLELALTGRAGAFGGRARVLWAGLRAAPELAALAERTQAALAPLGFAFEQRPFHAHLTLARAGRGQTVPRGLADAYQGPAAVWTVAHLELLRSRLSRSGARYELLARWLLGRAAPGA